MTIQSAFTSYYIISTWSILFVTVQLLCKALSSLRTLLSVLYLYSHPPCPLSVANKTSLVLVSYPCLWREPFVCTSSLTSMQRTQSSYSQYEVEVHHWPILFSISSHQWRGAFTGSNERRVLQRRYPWSSSSPPMFLSLHLFANTRFPFGL